MYAKELLFFCAIVIQHAVMLMETLMVLLFLTSLQLPSFFKNGWKMQTSLKIFVFQHVLI